MNKKKVVVLSIVGAFVLASAWMAGFSYGRGHSLALERSPAHQHQWAEWGQPVKRDGDYRVSQRYIQFHSCTNCGFTEWRYIQESRR